MGAGRLRVPVAGLEAGDVVLDESASRYVARVHRLGPGATLLLFDPARGLEAEATILEALRTGVRCKVDSARSAVSQAGRSITVLQGIGKADKPERVVRDATALGVASLVFIETARSVSRLGERAGKRADRWRAVAIDAARQSGRGDVPAILGPLALAQAVARLGPGALRLVLAPDAELGLAVRLGTVPELTPIVLLVGPEGGLTDSEIDFATAEGFAPVKLGPFVLRTETATTAALGALAARW